MPSGKTNKPQAAQTNDLSENLEIRNNCKERNASEGNLHALVVHAMDKIFLRLNSKLNGRVFFISKIIKLQC